jgi:flagellar biosynthetic protein FlhB
MSSHWDQKTEKPTEARRRLAREQGRVAVSRDLIAAFSLLGILLAFRQLGGPFLERAVIQTRELLQGAFSADKLTTRETAPFLQDLALEVSGLLLPALFGLLALVLISSLFQSGWVFRAAAVSPQLSRLSPAAGWGRVFSWSSVASGFFALAKCAWLAGGLYWAIAPLLDGRGIASPQNLVGAQGTAGVRLGSEYLIGSATVLVSGLIVLGALDWFYRWWRLERELMMTKEELKEELARQETPEIIRRKQRGLARRLVTAVAGGGGGVE